MIGRGNWMLVEQERLCREVNEMAAEHGLLEAGHIFRVSISYVRVDRKLVKRRAKTVIDATRIVTEGEWRQILGLEWSAMQLKILLALRDTGQDRPLSPRALATGIGVKGFCAATFERINHQLASANFSFGIRSLQFGGYWYSKPFALYPVKVCKRRN